LTCSKSESIVTVSTSRIVLQAVGFGNRWAGRANKSPALA
jgi:hypothetical protein